MDGCTCTDDHICDLCVLQRDWIRALYHHDYSDELLEELTRPDNGGHDHEQHTNTEAA